MARCSAAMLVYRLGTGGWEVLIGHMGGPFWARKDAGAWSIPKGEYVPGEDPLRAAEREFHEETGHLPPDGPTLDLGEFVQRGGKRVRVFARRGDLDAAAVRSNTFTMEWPPRSGRYQEFPEIDRAAWVSREESRRLLVAGQVPAIRALEHALGVDPREEPPDA